ncbi:GGDEF domain-containing protein [Pseudomonas oryzae]|uniref:diguanylate cyclase n=1 Tax=Pseudomonas oryzae TaxID=1392877 RepID=A0A1H1R8S0_9PSED|nr:sensor domain-containing diguanylate cyclase [Pseudomonas oryzae]SDS32172.1 diguanylate cyclase (GGDEF) domain-containing protein [Pseudomonas oryzae]
MRHLPVFRFDLRRLILLLTVATALLTLANTFHASYQVQRSLLIGQTLEANRVYASKLAESTEVLLAVTHQQLAWSATQLAAELDQPQRAAAEAERLKQQSEIFNSVYVVNAERKVLAIAPAALNSTDSILSTAGAIEAVDKRQPLVSQPYISVTGHLEVMIAHPIFAADGRYLGYVGGSIHLREQNILNHLLGEHFYRDGSYIYVVDRAGRLLYHPDSERLGNLIDDNPAVDALIDGQSGSRRLTNSLGIDMLAGYAPIASIGWGVVAQSPTLGTLKQLDGLMLGILQHALPLSLLSLLAIWWLSRLISQPLWQMASKVRAMDSQATAAQIGTVRTWYFEAAELKRALLAGLARLDRKIDRLSLASMTDPLTGLYNRRGLQLTLEQWQACGQPFAVIALDIDHFKQVNDTHGHAKGDLVLQQLAGLMRENSRELDVLCRIGGEEFVMLLPGTALDAAARVAERLRLCMTDCAELDCGSITLSLGVAHWPDSSTDIDQVLAMADQALYDAKRRGRNLVVHAEPGAQQTATD